jgi:hypothetical protein
MKRIFLLLLAAWTPAAMATFKCVDEKGITRIGETPPDECANVVMYEMSRGGQVIKTIDPTPTPEQLKVREEAAAKRKDAEKLVAEQNRKDQALLNTYASEKEFDVARDRNIGPINGRIKVTQERLASVDKRLKDIEDEMEFYKAGKKKPVTATATKTKDGKEVKARTDETPQMLAADQKRLTNERAVLQKSLTDADKEIAALHKKFDGDKQRWVDLKANPSKAASR